MLRFYVRHYSAFLHSALGEGLPDLAEASLRTIHTACSVPVVALQPRLASTSHGNGSPSHPEGNLLSTEHSLAIRTDSETVCQSPDESHQLTVYTSPNAVVSEITVAMLRKRGYLPYTDDHKTEEGLIRKKHLSAILQEEHTGNAIGFDEKTGLRRRYLPG